MSTPVPTEPGVLSFHKRCEEFYPTNAVDAPIGQQRQWYDALCAQFDPPAPDGMTKDNALVGGLDPLRDDARDYAARLAKAGVEVWFREEPQMIHAWLRARNMSEGARAGFDALCRAVAHFARRAGA